MILPRLIPCGEVKPFLFYILAKITSRKPSFHSERVENVYPDRVNALRKARLEPPIFPTLGKLWKDKDEKTYIENLKEPEVNKQEKHK